jgi:hypothetical protein
LREANQSSDSPFADAPNSHQERRGSSTAPTAIDQSWARWMKPGE